MAVALAAGLAFLACSDGDSDLPEESVRQIAGVAELATNAYASAGPEGLHDYLSPDLATSCSKEELVEALKGEPVPDGFRGVKSARKQDEQVSVTIIHLYGDEGREVEWTFVQSFVGVGVLPSWRLVDVPGLERCDA